MKHIELNAQAEAVKQFFLSLLGDPDGSMVELDGLAVARVIPASNGVSSLSAPKKN
jgi:hypothetical protein